MMAAATPTRLCTSIKWETGAELALSFRATIHIPIDYKYKLPPDHSIIQLLYFIHECWQYHNTVRL